MTESHHRSLRACGVGCLIGGAVVSPFLFSWWPLLIGVFLFLATALVAAVIDIAKGN